VTNPRDHSARQRFAEELDRNFSVVASAGSGKTQAITERVVQLAKSEKALVTFHTVAFEGSIGLVNILQALRLQRKGFKTTVLLYGPGVTLGVQRGFPKLGDEPFPGAQNFGNQLTKFMGEGGEIYCCRFALQMLYGHGEASLLPGIRPISPLDVLDLILLHRRDGAFILNTWTL